ncbi:MAG: low temperature requirement protein A [Hyphomonadaceae bacterium]
MTNDNHPASSSLLRDRHAPHQNRVGFAELFFDLVFVFAVTQLSHHLLHHPTVEGAMQTALLVAAMWTVWIFTAWVTNWLDCEKTSPRLMLFALMACGLVMSSSIPDAFGDRGLSFALAYVAMHIGRTIFMLYALKDGPANERANFQRILVWLVVSGALWIAGGLVEGDARWGFWITAMLLEVAGPWVAFAVPGMGRSHTTDWTIDPEHMAERCGLFVIIALGESVIVTGATFAELKWAPEIWLAFGAALLGTIAMWWIYFVISADVAKEAFAHHKDPGAIARAAYTYGHIPIIAGIIVTAVSDEMILAHPLGHIEGVALAVTLMGPGLFMLGAGLFCWLVFREPPLSAAIGILVLVGLVPLAPYIPPVALSLATSGAVLFVAIWESLAQKREAAAAQHALQAEAPPT